MIMQMQDFMLQLPVDLYTRLSQFAQATRQPLQDVLLRTVKIGSPPSWEEAPAEFQADLAALERLDDESLWQVARSSQLDDDMTRYQELLDKNADGTLSPSEHIELTQLRTDADRFLLRKAYAVDSLRWRGHAIPSADQLMPLQ